MKRRAYDVQAAAAAAIDSLLRERKFLDTVGVAGGPGSTLSGLADGRGVPTIMVAASDSTDAEKAIAAANGYVCSGTNDEVEIQQAIDDIEAVNGGRVLLSSGVFTVDDRIQIGGDDVLFQGMGRYATVIEYDDSTFTAARTAIIEVQPTQGCELRDFSVIRVGGS